MPKSKSKRIKRRRMRPHHVDHVVTDGRRGSTKIKKASACFHAGDLEQAKQLACEIIEQDETNADAWHVLGMTMHAAKSYVEAFECLEKARALVGDHNRGSPPSSCKGGQSVCGCAGAASLPPAAATTSSDEEYWLASVP